MLRSSIWLLIVLLFPASSQGHNDVSETIKALTAQLEKAPTADLYFQRATEFRALRESEHALEDLHSALKLDPRHRFAITSLIQLYGPSEKGLKLIKRYADFAKDPEQEFEATFLLAQHYAQSQMPSVALLLCKGLQEVRPQHDPALDLLHAQTLRDLDRHKQAATILKTAWKRTNSIVLRNNWIDTALTAGLAQEVLPLINQEIASSRFTSSWLIRRARAALALKNKEQAHRDLQAALAELSPRIRPNQPDLTLIADRGLILALLNNHCQARADLDQLEKSALPPSSYRLLRDALE